MSDREQLRYAGKLQPGLYVRARSDGSTVYEVRRKISGRVKRRTLSAHTPSDAIREARVVVASLDAGTRLIGRTDMSLRELRDDWKTWASSPGSNYSARTVELYTDLLDRHVLRLLGGTTKAAAVTPAHLRGLIDKLNAEKLSGSSVHGIVTATSALLRFGVRRGLLESNPVRLLERGDRPSAKRRTEPRYLDRAQIDRLLAKMGDEFRPVAACMAFAGLRVSEVLALRWKDVDLDAEMLNVPGTKTASSAAPVPMIEDLAAELRSHRSRFPGVGDALVFATGTGQPQWRRNVLRAIYAAGDAANLNSKGGKRVGCHDLRHSCAGLLLAAGVSPTHAAAVLRHADTRTLLTVYAGLVESQRAELRSDLEAAFSR